MLKENIKGQVQEQKQGAPAVVVEEPVVVDEEIVVDDVVEEGLWHGLI
jgi:hypothetical protein